MYESKNQTVMNSDGLSGQEGMTAEHSMEQSMGGDARGAQSIQSQPFQGQMQQPVYQSQPFQGQMQQPVYQSQPFQGQMQQPVYQSQPFQGQMQQPVVYQDVPAEKKTPKFDEHKYGKFMEIVGSLAKGHPPEISEVMELMGDGDTQFWKGSMVGAATVFALNNEAVKGLAATGVAKIMNLFGKSVQEIRMADITRNSSAHPILAATVAAGFTGAVVGGTVAMAKSFNQVRKGNLQKDQAVKAVFSESAGTGIATASAAAVIGISGLGGSLLGLIGFVGVAVGTKCFWDNLTVPEPADVKDAQEVPAVDKFAKNADAEADTGTESVKEAESVKGDSKKKARPKTKKSSSAFSSKKEDETPKQENPQKIIFMENDYGSGKHGPEQEQGTGRYDTKKRVGKKRVGR
eukprot:TRINITY_DN1481_c0_g1_i5.p1 TRINITY_DN1481_c0_g1~~TRINITY_DN1481_c0_g1_i5.p1  ORF type:complete len:404 (+),score=62.95 TRINITY_DN1481_c0_g1_i5:50-1261(+)